MLDIVHLIGVKQLKAGHSSASCFLNGQSEHWRCSPQPFFDLTDARWRHPDNPGKAFLRNPVCFSIRE